MTYAFEIIPVALNIPCKVESLDSWGMSCADTPIFHLDSFYLELFPFYLKLIGDKMYVGTPDGHVLLYVIEKQKSSDGKTTFVSFFLFFLFLYFQHIYYNSKPILYFHMCT
jgi:hypothetical protein